MTQEKGTINDKRVNQKNPLIFVVCTDDFMSGWGYAPNRSLMAFACHTKKEMEAVEISLKGRSEMKRVREANNLPKLKHGDHLTICDNQSSPEFFKGMAANWMKSGA